MKIEWQRRSTRLRLAVWNTALGLVVAGSLSLYFALAEGRAVAALRHAWVLAAVGIMAAIFFARASYAVANRVLAPVRQMAERTRSLSVKSLSERLPVVNAADDLGQLARGFNEALARFEGAYRELDRLTADVSHELRTPLTAMRSIGEVAVQENDPARLRDALGSILEEIGRMNHLINRLLLLARADNDEMPVQLEATLVNRILREVVDILSRVAEEKQQQLDVVCPDYLLAVFDPALLRLALMNLVQNAIRYSPPGTCITVRGTERDNGVVVEVIDEGPGIPPEHQKRVFERFYRVDKARSRTEGGVGLGLAIVKWSIERMGGTVTLESVAGRGCTFAVRLKRVTTETAAQL